MADVLGKVVPFRQLDLGKVGEDEVSALGFGVREAELVEDLAEAGDLGAHLGDGFGPEVVRLGLLETDGGGFLQRRHARVTDAGVGRSDVLDELGWADQVADAPAGGPEVLARATNSQCNLGEFRGEAADADEGDEVEPVVDFIGEDEDFVFEAEVADVGELRFGKDFADRVMRRVEDDHLRGRRDGGLEFRHVECPVGGRGGADSAVSGRVEGNIFYCAAGHQYVGEVLVEERFKDDDFVPRLDKAHQCTKYSYTRKRW